MDVTAKAAMANGRRSGKMREGAHRRYGVICRPVSWLAGLGLKTPSRIEDPVAWFQARRSQLRVQLRIRSFTTPHRIPSFTPTMGAPTWWLDLKGANADEQPDFRAHWRFYVSAFHQNDMNRTRPMRAEQQFLLDVA